MPPAPPMWLGKEVVLLGVPGGLEQKTSILCNILDVLIYIGHIPIVSTLVIQTAEDGDENLFHGLNSTLIVEKIKCFGPRWTWIKTIVFLPAFDRQSTDRCFLYACYGNPVSDSFCTNVAYTPRA